MRKKSKGKLSRRERKQHNQEVEHLQERLDKARATLAQAYEVFDQVVDPDLVEACIFQMNASLCECNYLVRTIKHCTPQTAMLTHKEGSEAWI